MDPALPAQASAARVIRSCSRFCPPLSIVPNPAADPGADAIHATTTRNATSLQRRRRTSRPPYRHHPELATPPTRPRRGITRVPAAVDATATLPPSARRSLTQRRWSAAQARITTVRAFRRNSMINLTYDEQGTNGHESYDPRPELNSARESETDSPQRQGARYTAADALLVEPARRYPSDNGRSHGDGGPRSCSGSTPTAPPLRPHPRRYAKSARHGFSKNGTGPPPRHPDEPRDPAYRGATT